MKLHLWAGNTNNAKIFILLGSCYFAKYILFKYSWGRMEALIIYYVQQYQSPKTELLCADTLEQNGCIFFFILWPGSGLRLLPTSHIKVSRGRVAHAFHIRRHALVLPLVSLLAVLNLQGTWEMTTSKRDTGGRDGGGGGGG